MSQNYAPKLPITDLENALALQKRWLSPLLNKQENEKLDALIVDFKKTQGPILADKLAKYVESLPDNNNWMAPYWTKMYLGIRDSLLTDSNYNLHLAPFNQIPELKGSLFKSHWILSLAQFYKKTKEHPPISETHGAFTTCTINTANILGCARIPAKNMDIWEKYSDKFLTNIAVFYQGRCFLIAVFNENKELLSAKNIASQLDAIRANKAKSCCEFLASSFQGSDFCAEFLEDFLQDSTNKASFEALNATIFHVILTDEDYTQSDSQLMDLLCATRHPYWCYKPVTCLMWNNNQISLHMEHTGADGTSVTQILQQAKNDFLGNKPSIEDSGTASMTPLSFVYTPEQIKKLEQFESWYKNKTDEFNAKIYNAKIGPQLQSYSRDALGQILMQYGMRKILAQPASIYASCTMSHFKEGRTEALRTVSQEIQDFISELEKTKKIDKNLLENAVNEHKNRIKICKKGLAPSRYLQGLSWVNDDPSNKIELFNDSIATRLGENYFSTSNLGGTDDLCSLFLFTPPQPSHYGFGYLTSDEGVRFCISYYKKEAGNLEKMIKGFDEFEEYTK